MLICQLIDNLWKVYSESCTFKRQQQTRLTQLGVREVHCKIVGIKINVLLSFMGNFKWIVMIENNR